MKAATVPSMRILVAAAEFAPLVSSGGLGDAIAGLAGSLVRQGASVSVVIPRYRSVSDIGRKVAGSDKLFRHKANGVEVLLVDEPDMFDRDGIYGPESGEAYEDNWLRWTRFGMAVADLANTGTYDIVNLHDAHSALAATRVDAPTVFTIHNAAYPLLGPLKDINAILGLRPEVILPMGALEWFGEANFMKVGLIFADQVTTVSPGFARQIAHDSEVTGGLDGVIRSLPNPPVGIMNGIDVDAFDPATDASLPLPFETATWHRRRENRRALADAMGLDASGIIFGMVGRVTGQKGFDLIAPSLADLVDEGFRLLVVGNGEEDDMVDGWVAQHPSAVAHRPFDQKLARLTWAGSDAYVMPSRFEPGGLGNIYAMRYGCPPVVRLTGGLADTVIDIAEDPESGNGIGFRLYEAAEFSKSVRRAMRLVRSHPELWREMATRGMESDWSWDRAAGEYLKVYRKILAPGPSA